MIYIPFESKDGNVIGAVVVVDDLKNADLEQIREEYIGS
jgi:plastocyanin domain-containing protein